MRAQLRETFRPLIAGILFFYTLSCFGQDVVNDPPELSLDKAIQIALENNRPLQTTKLNIDMSKWQVSSVKAKRFPIFDTALFAAGNLTSPSFTFQRGIFGPVNGSPSPSEDVHIKLSNGVTGYASASVTQPLSQLYQIHLAVLEQQLGSVLASEQYKQQRQSLVAEVKQAYYAALQTESALDSAQALVKQYQETDRVTLQYVAQESVLKADSLDVKAKLAQARYQIVALNNNLVTQKEHLNDLLGRDLDTPFRTEAVPPASAEEMDLKVARQTALRQRPEVKQAELSVSKANYDRKLAKAQYIPDVAAALRYFTPINTEILPQNILSAGMSLTWDPFDWGQRRDTVKEKDIAIQQSQYQLSETRSQIMLDVDNNFRQLSQSRQLLSVAQASRDAANERLREVSNQFKRSAVLLRDVLQQEAAVANADHDYEQSLLSFWNAKASFEKALGEE